MIQLKAEYKNSVDMTGYTLIKLKVLVYFWLICLFVLGLMTQTLMGHLYHLPEKGRKEIEEIVEEIKGRDRGERGK